MLYRIRVIKSDHKYMVTDEDGDSRIFNDNEFLNFISSTNPDDQWIMDNGMIPS